MAELQTYDLRIDGDLFRRQRQLLLALAEVAADKTPYVPQATDRDLVEGIISLLDEIADQAHDRYGIDCLLEEAAEDDGRCECEQPGAFCSGVPGILAHMEGGRLAPGAGVERCDLCRRYPSDEAALDRLRELGRAP
jgi:hypothetical protein